MKKQALLVASLCLAIGFTSAPACAQAGGLHISVPFSFNFAERSFPAGDYMMVVDGKRITIRDDQGLTRSVALADLASGRTAAPGGRVIFHCYSDHCFVSEVWSPGRVTGMKLVATKTEEEWAKKESKTYFALAGDGRQRK